VLLQQVQDGSATRSDLLKEQTQTAALEVQVLSDILVLIREERALEKLIGVEPGGLVRLVGGDREGS
jgi:outer membrane protein TolC